MRSSNLGRRKKVCWSDAPEWCWYTRVPRVQYLMKEEETKSVCADAQDTPVEAVVDSGAKDWRGVGSTRRPNCNPPCGVAQGDLLIPDTGCAVGADGGGVGTKGRKWVRHIKEWSMKHVVSG